MFVLDGELVCAWFEGVALWLEGFRAWAVELFEAGACNVLVPLPELSDEPAAV
ncbi:hypothetical protein [Bradyrhizobium manausense]|uniref:hypothetical protein n=1 Tax=Bradyrhizobium manausense TaxID=989370 RepID=UPI001FDA792A|nr:hypothetical protein [Bradyrhizobium manausense]